VLGSVAHAVVGLSGRPVLLACRTADGRGRSICRANAIATVVAAPAAAPTAAPGDAPGRG
jgi:hypothetical protein